MRKRGHRAPLPLMRPPNVHSLANKTWTNRCDSSQKIRTEADLLPCASLKPGSVNSSRTVQCSCLDFSSSERTATRNLREKQRKVDYVLGVFNRANLTHKLPKYRQHITCPTRDTQTLDHCFTGIKDAYRSVPRAALRHSDNCLVHLSRN